MKIEKNNYIEMILLINLFFYGINT